MHCFLGLVSIRLKKVFGRWQKANAKSGLEFDAMIHTQSICHAYSRRMASEWGSKHPVKVEGLFQGNWVACCIFNPINLLASRILKSVSFRFIDITRGQRKLQITLFYGKVRLAWVGSLYGGFWKESYPISGYTTKMGHALSWEKSYALAHS